MFLYRNILSKSWKITWKNKYLWFFGFFSALLGSGEIYRFTRGEGQDSWIDFSRIASTGVFNEGAFSRMGERIASNPLSLAVALLMFLLFLALFLFLVWLACVSEGALVNNSSKIIKNKSTDFRDGMETGREKFWPILGLNLLIKFTTVILLAISGLVVFQAARFTILQFIPFLVSLVFVVIFSFIIKYAVAYVVIKGKGFVEAIKEGFELFFDNWLVSVEMAIILFFISFMAGLAVVLALFVFAIPLAFLAFVFYKVSFLLGFWLISILSLALYLAIVFLGGAVLSVFRISSWTDLFLELTTAGAKSKIVRMLSKNE